MEFLNSTTTGATVGSWLYRVANAPEYESSVLHAIGPGQVTVLGQSTIHLDHSYSLASVPIPTDPLATVHRDPLVTPAAAVNSRPVTAAVAISSTSPSSLVAGLTQMARGAAEHLVATVATSPISPTFSSVSTAPATTSVSAVTSTPTMLTHRSTPVDVPNSFTSPHPRSRHTNRTESWAILDSDTADCISSYIATHANGATPTAPSCIQTPRANGAVTDSLANLALTESAIDVGAWHTHQPSPPAAAAASATHLSGSPVFIPNLASPRASRPMAGTPQTARASPPATTPPTAAAGRAGVTRRLSGAKLSSSVISMPDEDDDDDDDEFSDSDRSMSVIAGSSSGEVLGAGSAGNDTVVLDMMGASAFVDSSSGSEPHERRRQVVAMEEESGGGSGDGGIFTLVTTIPGTTPPQTTVSKPRGRKASMDLDDFLHPDDDLLDNSTHHPRTRPFGASAARNPPAPHPLLSPLLGTWHALPWFTYRTGLDHNTFRSDTGWGCMHRTVQMLVARAFLTCVFDVPHVSAKFATRERGYRAVMDMFGDNVREASGSGGWTSGGGGAFALPKICEVGAQQFGVRPGAWFSPTVAAQVMHRLNDRRRVAAGLRASSELMGRTPAGGGFGGGSGTTLADELIEIIAKHPLGNAVDLVTHVAMDGMITPEPIVGKAYVMGDAPNGKPLVGGAEEAKAEAERGRWRPLLLMVPVRLGLDEIGKQYVPSLVDVFSWPQFVGCAGGRKDASLYFAGTWTRPIGFSGGGGGGASHGTTSTLDETRPHQGRAVPVVTHWSPPRPSGQPDVAHLVPPASSLLSRTSLLFLDPHFPQPIPPPTSSIPNPSYHTSVIRALPMSRLDPCMLLGFLFRTYRDWEDFLDRANAWDSQAALFSVPDGWSALSRPSTADGNERNDRPRKGDGDDQRNGADGNDDLDGDVPFGLDSGLLDQVSNVEPVSPVGGRLRQPTPIKAIGVPSLSSSQPVSPHQVSKPTSIPPLIPAHMSRIPKPSSLPSASACRVDLKCRGTVSSKGGIDRKAGEPLSKAELVSPYVHISPKTPTAAVGSGRGQHLAGHHVPLR
ncbi:hypothetical protein BCR44DRAFT_1441370 [Catenaria anguillulae PL171]|uniref:Autophagy-related protein 4 n=1 Tax=Catenaria anguillulae PL171 TaxID=765915 RepID=A0A1Y2HBI2_9FUNG|nr:hypothetical protein BCR44DRAFT_1441370 [Catenaria anguillulae PL171]